MDDVHGFVASLIDEKELDAYRELAPAKPCQAERRLCDIDDIARLVAGVQVEPYACDELGDFLRLRWLDDIHHPLVRKLLKRRVPFFFLKLRQASR